MVNALSNLGGEFTGKYYPLSKMTEAEQDQLINVYMHVPVQEVMTLLLCYIGPLLV